MLRKDQNQLNFALKVIERKNLPFSVHFKTPYRSVIKRPADSTTSTTSGQTEIMSGQTSTTSGQTNGQTNITSGQTN